MGLLSTLPPRPPRTSSAPVRTYLTEGQLWGSAFHLTTDLMFWTGLLGPLFFRRNLIVMLLCTELVMLACNMNFLFASAYFNDMSVSGRKTAAFQHSIPHSAHLMHAQVCLGPVHLSQPIRTLSFPAACARLPWSAPRPLDSALS